MFCNNCGTYAPDNSAVCPNCGTRLMSGPAAGGAAPQPQPQAGYQNYQQPAVQPQPQYNQYQQSPDVIVIDKFASTRNLHDYIFAIMCYGGFIPIIMLALADPLASKSEYLKFHMNQALVLYLFALLSVIPIVGWLWSVFVVVCEIMAVIFAFKGQAKSATFFGKIRIIK